MSPSQGIRLVTELEAARILELNGYKKEECPDCKAVGSKSITVPDLLEQSDRRLSRTLMCTSCDGQGWRWKPPPK